MGIKEVHVREESRVFHQDLLSSWGMEEENEENPQQAFCYRACMTLQFWIWRRWGSMEM